MRKFPLFFDLISNSSVLPSPFTSTINPTAHFFLISHLFRLIPSSLPSCSSSPFIPFCSILLYHPSNPFLIHFLSLPSNSVLYRLSSSNFLNHMLICCHPFHLSTILLMNFPFFLHCPSLSSSFDFILVYYLYCIILVQYIPSCITSDVTNPYPVEMNFLFSPIFPCFS